LPQCIHLFKPNTVAWAFAISCGLNDPSRTPVNKPSRVRGIQLGALLIKVIVRGGNTAERSSNISSVVELGQAGHTRREASHIMCRFRPSPFNPPRYAAYFALSGYGGPSRRLETAADRSALWAYKVAASTVNLIVQCRPRSRRPYAAAEPTWRRSGI